MRFTFIIQYLVSRRKHIFYFLANLKQLYLALANYNPLKFVTFGLRLRNNLV